MKQIIFSLCILSFGYGDIYENLFMEGNQAIFDGKYQDAIQIYESILEMNYESSQVYYNLGNAYYRLNLIGQSIWSYMKASRLDPRNADIKHNLSISKAKRIDRIQLPNTFFILKYYRALKHFFTLKEWMLFGSIFFILNSLVFFLYKMGYLEGKILGKTFSILFLLTICIHFITLDKYLQYKKKNLAVIVENSVDAYSGPFFGNNTILFKINEGSIADISKAQKDWVEIILVDGKTGWITAKSIREL